MGVGAAAQVVVEEAVAVDGDRGGGDIAAGGEGEGEPGAARLEDAVEVGATEEVALGGGGASHRLLVGGEKAGSLAGRRLRARDDAQLVAAAQVLADLLAVAHPALGRQGRVGDLDDVALGRACEWRVAERVANEGADETGGLEVDRRGIEAALSGVRISFHISVRSANAGGGDEARVAVGGDRVALLRPGDRAHDQRGKQLHVVRLDAKRVGDALGVEEGARAEELLARRGLAAVGEKLGDRAHSRSAAAARNSSGSTPQTSQSSGGSPSRRRWARIVPSCFQPRLATVRFATSLRAGMRP